MGSTKTIVLLDQVLVFDGNQQYREEGVRLCQIVRREL